MAQTSVSMILTITIITLFSLRSFAAPQAPTKPSKIESRNQTEAGTITVSGAVAINGSTVQTGATVLSGSVISTSSGGQALVNLGMLGVYKFSKLTTGTIIFSSGLVEIRTTCSKTKVEVTRGTVDVKSPRTETLVAGKREHFEGGVNALRVPVQMLSLIAKAGVKLQASLKGRV